MAYIGTEPKDIRSFGRTKFDYTATQGQTAFTGADDDGKVLAFTVGQIEVYVNGILMDDSDFSTSNGNTVTLATAANLNDVINIVSFETNIPDSNYVPASGGTFTGDVDFGSNKITYANKYDNLADLPSASTYHGMFAHVHATGLAYYAHAGAWIPLANLTGAEFTGDLTVDTNTFHVDAADNRVGIGTTAPYKPLTISSAIGGTKSDILDIQSSTAGGGTQPMVRFGTEAGNNNTLGRIGFVDIPNYGGGFVVETNSSGAATHTTTEKFRIDKDGRVTTPNQPAFKAYLTSTQANVTGNAPVYSNSYSWTSVFNIGSHFNGSGTFTAPVAGRYLFAGHWALQGTAMGDASYHTFAVNGSMPGYSSSGLSMFDPRSMEWDQDRVNCGGTSILSLNANDYVTMYGGNLDSGGANTDLVGGNVWHTTIFSGYLIG